MNGKTLILIAHFDQHRGLSRDLVSALDVLATSGAADIALISTGLTRDAIPTRLKNIRVVIRANEGYDFYSWRHGILHYWRDEHDLLVLFNNSFHIVDPVRFCQMLFEPIAPAIGLQGLTVSWERSFHAQSYLIKISRQAAMSVEFRQFWQEMIPISDREMVVTRYELGLSQRLASRFQIAGMLPINDYEKFLMVYRRLPDKSWLDRISVAEAYEQTKHILNPSLLLWDLMCARFGIVKRQLIQQNPFKSSIDEIRRFLLAQSGT